MESRAVRPVLTTSRRSVAEALFNATDLDEWAELDGQTLVEIAVSTSTCRSLATISSGLCHFLPISNLPQGPNAILRGGLLFRGQTTFP